MPIYAPTGDPVLDFHLEAGPRALTPETPERVRLEIAKSSAFGAYKDACRLLAQHQVALMHEQIRQIGIENQSTDWQATRSHLPYFRVPPLVWHFFEAIYGEGCWQDEEFTEDFLKHHPECRVPVKRGINGMQYVNGKGR